MRVRLLTAMIGIAAVFCGGCGPLTFVVDVSGGDQKLRTTTVAREPGWIHDRIVIIDISGLIFNASRPGILREHDNPVSVLQEKLEKARQDQAVKAVILRVNSPGGTVTASDIMYREIERFRRETGKPVIALLMDVAASGGYYVSCAGDAIVSYPTTITGSIGVIVQTVSVQPALGRIGVVTDAITSGPNKDMASPLSTLTPAQRALLQSLVDDFYARFVAVVKEHRPGMSEEDLTKILDGRIVGGEQAAAMGLVDQVGDLQDALTLAKRKAGIARASLVLYHRPLQYVGSPYARGGLSPAVGTQINLAQINMDGLGEAPGMAGAPVGVYYLWQPMLP